MRPVARRKGANFGPWQQILTGQLPNLSARHRVISKTLAMQLQQRLRTQISKVVYRPPFLPYVSQKVERKKENEIQVKANEAIWLAENGFKYNFKQAAKIATCVWPMIVEQMMCFIFLKQHIDELHGVSFLSVIIQLVGNNSFRQIIWVFWT